MAHISTENTYEKNNRKTKFHLLNVHKTNGSKGLGENEAATLAASKKLKVKS